MNELIPSEQPNQLPQQEKQITPDMYQQFIHYVDAMPNTVKTYTRALKQFFKYLYENGIQQPQRSEVLAFRDYLKDTGKKASTVQSYIVAVRLFFQWTAQQGYYPNIADKIKGASVSKGHKKDYLTTGQIQDILNSIERDTLKGLRDYAILALMVTCGLRTIEVSRANIEDLRNVGDTSALYIQGKGREDKTEYVKLAPPVEKAIRNYLKAAQASNPTQPLFTSTSNNNKGKRLTTRSISSIVKERMKKAGYDSDRLTAHSLRHTAGTLNLMNGGTLEETQQLLRHSNINTTMVYLHHLERANNQSEQRIAGAIFK
ncbi:tyrosine-type recombinase/integrase [Domibacillus sp. 8LH]|uniref:tyrosine-type recombinase/integrase n=1 Tax=Domibacillus sp. 8LH TaxID=3073900 RepID=UPI00317539C2